MFNEDLLNMTKEELDNECCERLEKLEKDADMAYESMQQFKETFMILTNHVTTVTTLEKNEYDEFLMLVQDFVDESEVVENVYNSEYDPSIVGRTLRHLAINACFEKIGEKLPKVLEYTTIIEERLDSSDFRNPQFIPLIQLIWNKFGDEIDNFSYDNLDEQSSNNQPWLVVDTREVVYIQSFPSKTEAQRYVMQQKGLNHKNIVCRY